MAIRSILTPMERAFVDNYNGDATGAAKKAGYKHPGVTGCKLMKKPRVANAIAERQAEISQVRRSTISAGVKITRNDIINRLDNLSLSAESESVKVAALRELKDIFGLSVGNAKDTDLFAGWTDEELESYRSTGTLPPRLRSVVGESESSESDSSPSN